MSDNDSRFSDADANDPLAALRIPVTSEWPHHGYLAAYAGHVALTLDWPRPDDAEAATLACYIDYKRSKYERYVQRRMLAEPFDAGDRSAVVFVKRGADDWAYRATHWTSGPFWVPLPEHIDGGLKLSLTALLDNVETSAGTVPAPVWDAWKAVHPDVFEDFDVLLPGMPASHRSYHLMVNGAPLLHWVYRCDNGYGISVRQGSRTAHLHRVNRCDNGYGILVRQGSCTAHGVYGDVRDGDYEVAVVKFDSAEEWHTARIDGVTDTWPDKMVTGWRKLEAVQAIYREVAAYRPD
jgi:hypothetical protein